MTVSQQDSNVEQVLEIIQEAVQEQRERTRAIGDVGSFQEKRQAMIS